MNDAARGEVRFVKHCHSELNKSLLDVFSGRESEMNSDSLSPINHLCG